MALCYQAKSGLETCPLPASNIHTQRDAPRVWGEVNADVVNLMESCSLSITFEWLGLVTVIELV